MNCIRDKKDFVTNNKVLLHRLLPNKKTLTTTKKYVWHKRQLFTTFKRHFKVVKKLFRKEMNFERYPKVKVK
jgi:hypothetical protein